MADINVSGRMKVKSLKKDFKKEFGLTLRVYKGKQFADEDATLASIRKDDGSKTCELSIRGNMLVRTVEDGFKKEFGITVQVADADDKKLADNNSRLSQV